VGSPAIRVGHGRGHGDGLGGLGHERGVGGVLSEPLDQVGVGDGWSYGRWKRL
jgi:hypothetical protein